MEFWLAAHRENLSRGGMSENVDLRSVLARVLNLNLKGVGLRVGRVVPSPELSPFVVKFERQHELERVLPRTRRYFPFVTGELPDHAVEASGQLKELSP